LPDAAGLLTEQNAFALLTTAESGAFKRILAAKWLLRGRGVSRP
jgi:hypothetical protein